MNAKQRQAEATAYITGYLAACEEMEIPFGIIASRLGQLLFKAWERTPNRMSSLPRKAYKKRKALAKMALDERPHKQRTQSIKTAPKKQLSKRQLVAMRTNAAKARTALAARKKAA